ncbi:MAG TPA: Stp1/IreP family PP2C-type Ser/Thr phosphatase [Actinomycetota bacterium]|jgi:PPM family protein phosphatase|nr:Stp1/IreP family PP2C-type Ser/Thr phosphatase [Actinomycetota bacterium]
MRLVFAAATDVGRMRKNNEDSYLSSKPVAAVADGMGGHSAGEVASAIAIEELAALGRRGPWANETDATDDLKQAILRANRRIREMAASDRKLNGMGTTLVALLEDGDMVHVANVGDSRGYLLRQGELSQVTVDHSLVQELVDDGRLSPEDAERHPQRSVITRALGIDPEVEFDLFTYKLLVGDRLLLCSDGLSDVVEPAQIRKVLLRVRSAQRAARELVTVANDQGGPDNITVIVVDAVDDATAEAEEDGGDTTGDLAAGSATGALPLVGDAELDGDRRAGSGRAARAAKDRSLAMHRRLQRVLIAGIVVVALAVLLVAGRGFLMSRYWVGFDGDTVAVFQGVPGNVAGIRFSRLVERSPVTRAQVPPGYAARLDDGVQADDLADARNIALCAPQVFSPDGCTGAPATTATPTTAAATTTSTRAPGG